MKTIYILIFLLATTAFSIESIRTKSQTGSQMISSSTSMLVQMEATLTEAYSILKKTRKEKDVIKLNCVNESITKIKGLLKRSKDDLISLQESVSKDDMKASNYYFTKISLASDNIKQGGVEVLSCTGTITIEMTPVVGVTVEELVVEKDYVENNNSQTSPSPIGEDDENNSNTVELSPIQASPYF